MDSLPCDVLVIGGSLAGLRAAIAAREAGANVILLSRGIAGRSGSAAVASNDLCGYLPDADYEDTAERFSLDTITAGRGINEPALVVAMVADAGERILELERFGVKLISLDGRPDRFRSGGHSRARSYRVLPIPGKPLGIALTMPMRLAAEGLGVRLIDRSPVLCLTLDDGRVTGAVAVDLASGLPLAVTARAVVLATGGGSFLYERTNATNDVAGEGYALALQAGAALRDMEFIQFHPTRMDYPISRMLSEGLTDDGALLRNRHGEEFMYRYHPEGVMAPRDVRCRAIFEEIQRGHDVDGYVLLDCSPVPSERIALRHQHLAESLRKAGVDFPAEPIRVSPAAHFFMGGVVIDSEGATSVPGLYAAGEVAGGVHGANRVGSAAYSEALVFGRRAGQAAAAHARQVDPPAPWREGLPVAAGGVGTMRLSDGWRTLRAVMWKNVSLQRSGGSLEQARAAVAELRQALPAMPEAWVDRAAQVGFCLALTTAEAVIRSALLREESRGAHWRVDFPTTDDRLAGSFALRLRHGQWHQQFHPSKE